MISSAKVLWGEGLFLRPQHFQRQDAYHEWRLAQVGRVLNPYAWGVRSVKVDTEALAIGQLRLLDVQALFQDGELFSAPHEDPLPASVALDATMGAQGEETFYLALPAMRAQIGRAHV